MPRVIASEHTRVCTCPVSNLWIMEARTAEEWKDENSPAEMPPNNSGGGMCDVIVERLKKL